MIVMMQMHSEEAFVYSPMLGGSRLLNESGEG